MTIRCDRCDMLHARGCCPMGAHGVAKVGEPMASDMDYQRIHLRCPADATRDMKVWALECAHTFAKTGAQGPVAYPAPWWFDTGPWRITVWLTKTQAISVQMVRGGNKEDSDGR